MNVPRATMRLQFHKGFTFADATALVSYFASLGVSHIYASPIMTARAGSPHGYDVIDPTRVNPELGGADELRRFVHALRQHAMGLIVDTVPNHMVVGKDNPWWMDVLAHGRNSRYAKFFDIDWSPLRHDLQGKVLLPILARPYGEALNAGEIRLCPDAEPGAFVLRCFDHVLPVAGADADEVASAGPEAFDPNSSAGRERLHRLLERQHYRLAWWRCANDDINWRRFFDINELAAVRVEDDEVFEAVHATLLRLYAEGLIDGIRVDHVDGLAWPEKYCRTIRGRLRELEARRPSASPGGRAYFVVEKILGRGEYLPRNWETDGTTGYDFMDEATALLHDPAGEQPLTALWQRLSANFGDFARVVELARRQILERSFAAQHEATVETLYAIAQSDLTTRDFSRAAISRALREILAHFPVYRIYDRIAHASRQDRAFLEQAIGRAKVRCLPSDRWMVETLGHWLAGERIRPRADRLQALALVRFQQLSAPLCAKAVEDTAFYRYGRLLSRNDVGFDPQRFAYLPAEFHRNMRARANNYPHAMLATATHDHKRGEDVRSRLAVLSELAADWEQAIERWMALAAPLREAIDGVPMPSAGDLAMLFQILVGAWPLELTPDDRPGLAEFRDRLVGWQQKALREAKLASDWASQNESYERAAEDVVSKLLGERSQLLSDIFCFVRRIAPAGAANGLAQLLVKLTAPGVPDMYQGTEYWDFTLVDPDNRRPVDFAARQRSLGTVSVSEAATRWTDGHLKQALIARVLRVRRNIPRLFSEGTYLPINVEGPLAEHVLAFARKLGASAAITVVCRCVARLLSQNGSLAIPMDVWDDTRIVLPNELHGMTFADALSSRERSFKQSSIELRYIFSSLPVALLTSGSA